MPALSRKKKRKEQKKASMEKQTIAFILLLLTFCSPINGRWLPDPSKKTVEKLTQFQVYAQDIFSGSNPTVTLVARGNSSFTSPTFFGLVSVLDDPVRVAPDKNAAIIGRAQGLYASSSLEEMSIHMTFDLVFTNGTFNGSTLSVIGHNAYLSDYRELSVAGGTGAFRFAKGYVGVRTVSRDSVTGDAFFQYNVTVTQY